MTLVYRKCKKYIVRDGCMKKLPWREVVFLNEKIRVSKRGSFLIDAWRGLGMKKEACFYWTPAI